MKKRCYGWAIFYKRKRVKIYAIRQDKSIIDFKWNNIPDTLKECFYKTKVKIEECKK